MKHHQQQLHNHNISQQQYCYMHGKGFFTYRKHDEEVKKINVMGFILPSCKYCS